MAGGDDQPTDRRALLAKAATAAAGAVVGGAALAVGQASPAAAAFSDTGNPAILGTASPSTGIGVRGNASSGIGVAGVSPSGTGVQGETVSGVGVRGVAAAGVAISGVSTSGTGVVAQSTTGTGISANSTLDLGVAAESESGSAIRVSTLQGSQLVFGGSPVAPPGSSVAREAGAVVKDADGELWFCVAGGTPGVWRKVSGPSTSGAFHALATPKRVYDSRPGQPPAGVGPKVPLAASSARTVDLKENSSAVPAGATAVLVNLIATGTTSAVGGFMSIYRNGIAFPGTSNLNWSGPGQTVAVTTITAVDGQARCALYAGGVTDVVVDVLGYYR